MNIFKKKVVSYPALIIGYYLLPLAAIGVTELGVTLTNIRSTLLNIIALLFVLATLIFLWGVIQFIAKSGDEKARESAKGIMTWGIVGLAVMAAAWGVVQVLIGYFGVGGTRIPTDLPIIRP